MRNDQLLHGKVAQSLVVPTRNHQTIDTSGAGTFQITLDNPRMLVNPTDTDGFIAFMQADSDELELEFFPAGACKPYCVKTVYGTDEGTTVTKVAVKE